LLLLWLILLHARIDDDLAVGVRDCVEEQRGALEIRASNKLLDAPTPERRGETPFAQSFHQLTSNGGVDCGEMRPASVQVAHRDTCIALIEVRQQRSSGASLGELAGRDGKNLSRARSEQHEKQSERLRHTTDTRLWDTFSRSTTCSALIYEIRLY
jgi:hypothetical protein